MAEENIIEYKHLCLRSSGLPSEGWRRQWWTTSHKVCMSVQRCMPLLEQASDMDADSLRSRFRVLVPIYLGPIHVLACAWWAVGTWQLPNFWSPSFHPATPSAPASITIASWSGHSVVTAFNATAYNSDLLKHWVGWYPGAPTLTMS